MKIFRALVLVAVLSASFFVMPGNKNVSAAPFTCEPGFYQSMIFGVIKKLNPVDGSYQDVGISTEGSINAIGYNVQDNYIYGIGTGPSRSLIRLEHDATATNLGTPTGLSLASGYVAGDMDRNGNLYTTDNNNLWIIDVSAGTASSISLSSSIVVNDLVYINGFLYGTNSTNLYQINISDGTVSTNPINLPTPGVYGAGWATVEDKLYFGNNTSGIIYEINNYSTPSPTYQAALIGEGGLAGNDGASCSLAASAIVPIAAGNDSYTVKSGETLTIPASQGLLNNDVPEGVTVDSYTQPTNGTVVVNPDGSFTYTPSAGFVGTDNFTYTIINNVGDTETATVTIRVEGPETVAAGELADTGIFSGIHSSLAGIIALSVLLLAKYAPATNKYLLRK